MRAAIGGLASLARPAAGPVGQDLFHPLLEFLQSPQQIVVTLLKVRQAIQLGALVGGQGVRSGGRHDRECPGWRQAVLCPASRRDLVKRLPGKPGGREPEISNRPADYKPFNDGARIGTAVASRAVGRYDRRRSYNHKRWYQASLQTGPCTSASASRKSNTKIKPETVDMGGQAAGAAYRLFKLAASCVDAKRLLDKNTQ